MFSKTKGNGSTTAPAAKGMPSIISVDFRVVGNVSSDGDVQLDGSVDGNLKARVLTIGESGSVRGEVKAERVHVQGAVTGPIRARTIEIAKSAKVTGDVFYQSLTVEPGAVVDGACKRWDPDKPEKIATGDAKVESKIGVFGDAKPSAAPLPRIAASAP